MSTSLNEYFGAPASVADRIRRVTAEEWAELSSANSTGPVWPPTTTPSTAARQQKRQLATDAPWSGQTNTRVVELMPESQRYSNPKATYLRCVELARPAHTTKARSKQERVIDRRCGLGGLIMPPAAGAEFFLERGPGKTKIFPLALPRLKRLRGQRRKHYCRWCHAVFQCKRIDREYCSPKCRKAAHRAGKR